MSAELRRERHMNDNYSTLRRGLNIGQYQKTGTASRMEKTRVRWAKGFSNMSAAEPIPKKRTKRATRHASAHAIGSPTRNPFAATTANQPPKIVAAPVARNMNKKTRAFSGGNKLTHSRCIIYGVTAQ